MTIFLPEVFPYQKLRGHFYPIVSAKEYKVSINLLGRSGFYENLGH